MGDNSQSWVAGRGTPEPSERAERLLYLADLLSELQEIARREGCETLVGLLALSHAEAQRRASNSTV
jgi:hypothetical protein